MRRPPLGRGADANGYQTDPAPQSYPRPLIGRDYIFVSWFLLDVFYHHRDEVDCGCNACARWAA